MSGRPTAGAVAMGTTVVLDGATAARLDQILGRLRERIVFSEPALHAALVAIRQAGLTWAAEQDARRPSGLRRRVPLSTSEVAALKGVDSRAVRRACAAGHLPATRRAGDAGDWLIEPDAAAAWTPRRRT